MYKIVEIKEPDVEGESLQIQVVAVDFSQDANGRHMTAKPDTEPFWVTLSDNWMKKQARKAQQGEVGITFWYDECLIDPPNLPDDVEISLHW